VNLVSFVSQRALNILPEASFIIQVKNPETPTPPNLGLGAHQKADFPEALKRIFWGRRFVPGEPLDLGNSKRLRSLF
jgi:hypothetical protein